MKYIDTNIVKKGSLALWAIVALLLFSCEDREPEINYNHGFTVTTSNGSDTLQLEEAAEFAFTITPNREVANTTYTLTYEVTQGQGVIRTLAETVIAPSESYAITLDANATQQLQLLPQREGALTIAIRIADNHGGVQEFNVNYFVEDAPFSVTITPESDPIYEATTTRLVVNVTQREGTGTGYQMRINSAIPSDLVTGIADEDTTPLVTGEWYPIALGERFLSLTTAKAGVYSLSISIKNADNDEITRVVPITIEAATFTTSFAEASVNLTEGETKSVTLSIAQTPVTSSLTYRARLNTTSTIATFRLASGSTVTPNEWFDISSGDNVLQVNATGRGSYTAEFSVEASNEMIQTVNLPVTSTAVPTVSNITSGITEVGDEYKVYVRFDYDIDTSNGDASDPARFEIKFISGSTERIVNVDFATAPRHPSRAGYIQFDEGDVTNTDDALRLLFYQRNISSYEIKIITTSDLESASTAAPNRFRDYDFEE